LELKNDSLIAGASQRPGILSAIIFCHFQFGDNLKLAV